VAIRVVHWGTGNTGKLALRAILDHPDLELVGLVVTDPAKAGRDAGDLCDARVDGAGPVGIAATTDAAAALALDADCLSYYGDGMGRAAAALADVEPFLRAGQDVVTTSINELVYPPFAPPELRAPVEAACAAGGSSFWANGADPGFGSDLIPLTLLGLLDRVESVRVQEIVNYSQYQQAFVMETIFGFGQPAGYAAPLFTTGMLTAMWGGMVTLLADRLGVRLDGVAEHHEVAILDHDVEVAYGKVPAGTTAAIRFEVQGVVAGEPRIVIEHVTRMHDDAAPDWQRHASGRDGYRIVLGGRPDLICELTSVDARGEDGGLELCANRMVNAIPAVCAAPPGVLSALDLPLVVAGNVAFGR
jgi:2,4-diaminopentanoate dehydrogenase